MDDAPVNIDELIRRNSEELSIQPDTYRHILETMFTHGQQDIEKLSEAIDNEDIATIKSLAHRLKGEYANIRIKVLADAASSIDHCALNGGGFDEIKQSFFKLSAGFKQLKEKLG